MVYTCNAVQSNMHDLYESVLSARLDLNQYVHECNMEWYTSLHEDASNEKPSNKIATIIGGWISKIIEFGKKIKSFIIGFFRKIREKFKGKKIESFQPFEDYNYKDFIGSKIKSLDFLLHDGEEPNKKNTVDIIGQWSGEQHSYDDFINGRPMIINMDKCIDHLLGKKITIDEKYMSANDANNIMRSNIEKDLTSALEDKINQCKKLANGMKRTFDQDRVDDLMKKGTNKVVAKNMESNRINSMNLLLSSALKINTKLFNTSIEIITLYMKQLQKIVSSASSSGKNSEKNYNYRVTEAFYDAVNSGNARRVRIMMKNAMILDPTLVNYEDMKKAAGDMEGLYDEYDGKELIWDKNQWDTDYLDMMLVKVLYNFSHKRLDHLKQIVKFRYKDKIEEIENWRRQHK